MKTLILYATKHGATAQIANILADEIKDATVCGIKEATQLSNFDCVIIGSSVYAGSIRKEAKAFMAKSADELSKKTLGLFLSCLDDKTDFFDKNFPVQILQAAKAKAKLGGIFDPKKAGGFERFVIKAVMKNADYVNKINEDKIKEFVKAIDLHEN